ncbi:MAG TPA: Fur family transcriptional regulator [Candidatus Saccharimonadales bacterium]
MTTDELSQFRHILKHNGHQVTKTREAVFRLLLSPEPQTVNEILMKSGGTVDRVSVYRNLDLFEKLGIVHRIYIGWKYKIELSDEFTGHHHHLSCLQCGKTIDIEDERHIDEFIHQVAGRFGFQPRRHQFEIDGYCKDCQNV